MMKEKLKPIIYNSELTFGNYVNTTSSNFNNSQNNKLNRLCTTDINNTVSKLNYLDYTFISLKNSISLTSSFHLNNKWTKDYLYDLNQTLDLNLQLLEQTVNLKFNDDKLKSIFINIKKKIKEKDIKKNKINDLNSKLLIDKQIIEEKKRKIEENNDYYQDKINEHEVNCSNKIEYIKIVEKKLYEVEIYVQKNTKHIHGTKYDKYKNWRLRNFLDENGSIINKKNLLVKDKVKLQQIINEEKKENIKIQIEYKKDDEMISQVKNKNERKIKETINKYKKEIFIIGNRMKMLKSYFNELNKEFKYLSFSKNNTLKLIKSKQEKNNKNNKNNLIKNETNNNNNISMNNISINKDVSELPHDMTIKLNNFMDFSLILNKKDESKIDELMKTQLGGNPFANLSNTNIWDISAINKN